MGEPGGVCAEITIAAWRMLHEAGPPFFVIADPSLFNGSGVAVALIDRPGDAAQAFADALPVLATNATIAAAPGRADPANAAAVIESIERAVAFALSGDAAAVVTNPIQKSSLLAAGFSYPGHTEFLAALTDAVPMPTGRSRGPVMMIAGPMLRTVPVTIHQSVIDATRSLTSEMIVRAARVTAEALFHDFGVAAPRLAISGLNPHAGENGAMGREDLDIIAPAVAALRAAGVDARGPLPADTMFHEDARRQYDAALCMLHDQALIPAKTLAFHDAVNVTLGLPIIRTSPDHGTALDIAGKGLARADSLIAAIRLADAMATKRAAQ